MMPACPLGLAEVMLQPHTVVLDPSGQWWVVFFPFFCCVLNYDQGWEKATNLTINPFFLEVSCWRF